MFKKLLFLCFSIGASFSYGNELTDSHVTKILHVIGNAVDGCSFKDINQVAQKVCIASKTLSEQQYTLFMDMIRQLNKLTRFSAQELIDMVKARGSFDSAARQHCPGLYDVSLREPGEGPLRFLQELSNVDFSNIILNDLKDYLCNAIFFSASAYRMSKVNVSSDQEARCLQNWLTEFVCSEVALVRVLITGDKSLLKVYSYLFPDWEKELEKTADTFKLLHSLTEKII